MPKKNKLNTKPTKEKNHVVYFLLAKYFWEWFLLWDMDDLLSDTPLERAVFSPLLSGVNYK